jgi:hypothetical protein
MSKTATVCLNLLKRLAPTKTGAEIDHRPYDERQRNFICRKSAAMASAVPSDSEFAKAMEELDVRMEVLANER